VAEQPCFWGHAFDIAQGAKEIVEDIGPSKL